MTDQERYLELARSYEQHARMAPAFADHWRARARAAREAAARVVVYSYAVQVWGVGMDN